MLSLTHARSSDPDRVMGQGSAKGQRIWQLKLKLSPISPEPQPFLFPFLKVTVECLGSDLKIGKESVS